MSNNTKAVLDRAIALPAVDRAELVEKLIESLDPPDALIDKSWASEAELRIQAFEAGQIGAVSEEEAFAGLDG